MPRAVTSSASALSCLNYTIKGVNMTSTKPFWQSKTILCNLLILLLALADAARALPLPADWAPWIVAAASVLNVALRLTTSSGIAGFAPGEDPAYRAAHDAGGDPDRPNGGHPLRPTPAAPDAPPERAAGPSERPLVDLLAADLGVEPEHTPEDSI